jgi:hypothetical protein
MQRFSVSVAALLLVASCATTPAPVITGRFTDSDIEEIKQLVLERSEIKKPLLSIQRQTADSALVQTGHHQSIGDVLDTFTVHKRHGKWIIDHHSFTEERIVVTGS